MPKWSPSPRSWIDSPAPERGCLHCAPVASERIGVFGGTFDPIHVGHLVAAVNVRHAIGLDRLLMVVANVPWQKAEARSISPAEDRFAMVQAAVGDVPGLEASRVEIERGGASYTVDTLEELGSAYPGAELYCVLGADAARELPSWERAERIGDLATLVIVNRPGVALPAQLPSRKVRHVVIPALEVSSTDLRARAGDGRPLDYLIPDEAIHCIRARGLYAGPR